MEKTKQDRELIPTLREFFRRPVHVLLPLCLTAVCIIVSQYGKAVAERAIAKNPALYRPLIDVSDGLLLFGIIIGFGLIIFNWSLFNASFSIKRAFRDWVSYLKNINSRLNSDN